MNCYWIKNTDVSLAKLRRVSQGVAALPLASIESHGPHLPLGSDLLCIDYIMQWVLKQEPVAVLPTLTYSSAAAARIRPGTIHVRSELLMELVENICDEVYRNRFTKIVLIHGHGGNVWLHTAFTRRMLEREKPYTVYSVPVFAGQGEQIKALLDHDQWGHACESETSLNLVACPELVNLKALGKKTFPTQPAPDIHSATSTAVDWIIRHPEMAVGKPQLASRAKGEKMARIWAHGLIAQLRCIKTDTLTPRVIANYNRRVHTFK